MSWTYRAPVPDMRFVIEQVLDAPRDWALCGWDVDADTAGAVLEEAARFAAERLQSWLDHVSRPAAWRR